MENKEEKKPFDLYTESKAYAVESIRLYQHLTEYASKKELNLSKQYLISSTRVGDFIQQDNMLEAYHAASSAKYWLELLYNGQYIDDEQNRENARLCRPTRPHPLRSYPSRLLSQGRERRCPMKRSLIKGLKHLISLSSSLSLIILLSLSLQSCTSSLDEPAPTQLTNVTITFSDLDIYLAPDDVPTRATATEAKVASVILSVFDSSGKQVFTTTQASTDESFGTISTRIPVGDYTFTALAVADTPADVAITNKTTATFSAAPPKDTFSTSQNVTVSGDTSQNVTMTFGKRITTSLYVKVTDATPDQVKKMQVIVSPSATKPSAYTINPSTGLAANKWQYEKTVEKSETVTTFTDQYVAIMFFLTSATEQLDFTVNMLSATDEVLFTRTKTGVTFNKSAKTFATGTFFSDSYSTVFDFDTTDGQSTNIALD